jgi:metal-responsive CopG/Arc/MetJ family transcriptional regulator
MLLPTKKVIAFPKGLVDQANAVALLEHRTFSDLVREAIRRYIAEVKPQGAPEQND